MALMQGVTGDAFPRGSSSRYRQWLSRMWDAHGPTALVIGINPNTATNAEEDGMTRFLKSLLSGLDGEFRCGGYVLVNCCDLRDSTPKALEKAKTPCSRNNLHTVEEMLAKCDYVVASWGTKKYGEKLEACRREVEQLAKQSGKKIICFSPEKKPIYCGPRNANSKKGIWSSTPVDWY